MAGFWRRSSGLREDFMIKRKLAPLAALSLLLASSAAVAQSAASVAPAPASARVGAAEGGNELVGTTAWIIAAVALGLIVWGIIELTGDDEDFPNSP
jgi:hypothetical protein